MKLAKPTPRLPARPESSDAFTPSKATLEPGATPTLSSTYGCEKLTGAAHADPHSTHAPATTIDRHAFMQSPRFRLEPPVTAARFPLPLPSRPPAPRPRAWCLRPGRSAAHLESSDPSRGSA